MKKSLYFSLLFLATTVVSFSQAVLPTNWSFTTTALPTGWTESEYNLYPASGNPPPAKKFDSTGDYLLIHFASNPGNLTYYLTGNSFSGGTFTVEESDLGVSWTALRTHTTPPSATYTLFTDIPQSTTRYIRFIYTLKSSGNIGLDDVSIAVGAATPEQEINVKYGAATVVSGGTQAFSSPVSTMTPYTFTIENLGTLDTLRISNASISGANASDFSVASFPSKVAALQMGNLVVNFTPSASGTRNAVLTISSNDADEPSYIINLYGVGGTLATEPTSQATSLSFSNVKTYRLSASFASASGVDGYLVLRKKGSPIITGIPTDGTVYQRGDIVGDAQVVYSSNASSFSPNNIIASTQYYFAVFAYNGFGTNINYLTTSPLTGNVTTPNTMMPNNYYSTINSASNSFVNDLHNITNPHTTQFYSNYSNLMIKGFSSRDTTLNRRVVTCVYSGENKIYTEPFDFTSQGYSREHTYCHSWMPTNPAQSLPEYNDYHHLFPTNQNEVNALRSNYPLGEVVTVQESYLNCKLGLDANGKKVFEPRDEHKGDAARAMMYESICYTSVSGNLWAFPSNISNWGYGQDQYIIKQWHFQDPPSGFEIARNDYLDSLQGNRNPFIDSIDYVCFINFSNMQYESLGCLASIDEISENRFYIFPNPSKSNISFSVDGATIEHYIISDLNGRIIKNELVNNAQLVKVDVSNIKAGTYLAKVITPYGEITRKFIIE
jgi:endonuclease I